VDNLNLNIYKNQIFALLGHNGAGKTTTISMLTGLLDPTEGFISVFGETEMDNIRRMLGVCPQHDTLYEDLTVEEHLNLYATFKGLDSEERESEVNKLIKDVNLEEKRD
jgi:ATP-binding cassette, subfamily A (ABC1), member 3